MRIYYLDEPLSNGDLQFIKEFLEVREGKNALELIEQIRIPTLLKTPDLNGKYKDDIRDLIELSKKILIKSNLLKDYGKQIVWVIPKDNFWSGIFQMAISEITGYHPYVVQRWYLEDDKWVRRNIRLIDSHGIMGYKD